MFQELHQILQGWLRSHPAVRRSQPLSRRAESNRVQMYRQLGDIWHSAATSNCHAQERVPDLRDCFMIAQECSNKCRESRGTRARKTESVRAEWRSFLHWFRSNWHLPGGKESTGLQHQFLTEQHLKRTCHSGLCPCFFATNATETTVGFTGYGLQKIT